MDSEAILRLVDSLHRDKNIDKEAVFSGIEAALISAARKHYRTQDDICVNIDRKTGDITVEGGGFPIDPGELGRITAQTAKQVIIQKVREAECDTIFNDFMDRKGTIISGVVRRFEGPNMCVDLGKAEGLLRKSAQIFGEYYRVGERVRALIVDVKKVSSKARVILSRTHKDFVRCLFELEVPEISEQVIEIKGIARESGHRTKIAVASSDENVDCVGACVGVRGVRIKSVVDELNGEKIDIVKWSDEPEELLPNALKPAGVSGIVLSADNRSASVIVPDEQFSLAIGKRGQNVRLASVLTDWNLDIITESQFEQSGGEGGIDEDNKEGRRQSLAPSVSAGNSQNSEPETQNVAVEEPNEEQAQSAEEVVHGEITEESRDEPEESVEEQEEQDAEPERVEPQISAGDSVEEVEQSAEVNDVVQDAEPEAGVEETVEINAEDNEGTEGELAEQEAGDNNN